ncbi:hypothetical protein OUZ56_023511 [Daphnia magna]|uniref:Uncharacterized protein n=1 Tax=Daphnia magna TaxID=35525 RepID=A0ABR0AZ85_9CRUS|nr:hypothetical protein OUZ56_023511 [Daphnia magna]
MPPHSEVESDPFVDVRLRSGNSRSISPVIYGRRRKREPSNNRNNSSRSNGVSSEFNAKVGINTSIVGTPSPTTVAIPQPVVVNFLTQLFSSSTRSSIEAIALICASLRASEELNQLPEHTGARCKEIIKTLKQNKENRTLEIRTIYITVSGTLFVVLLGPPNNTKISYGRLQPHSLDLLFVSWSCFGFLPCLHWIWQNGGFSTPKCVWHDLVSQIGIMFPLTSLVVHTRPSASILPICDPITDALRFNQNGNFVFVGLQRHWQKTFPVVPIIRHQEYPVILVELVLSGIPNGSNVDSFDSIYKIPSCSSAVVYCPELATRELM